MRAVQPNRSTDSARSGAGRAALAIHTGTIALSTEGMCFLQVECGPDSLPSIRAANACQRTTSLSACIPFVGPEMRWPSKLHPAEDAC